MPEQLERTAGYCGSRAGDGKVTLGSNKTTNCIVGGLVGRLCDDRRRRQFSNYQLGSGRSDLSQVGRGKGSALRQSRQTPPAQLADQLGQYCCHYVAEEQQLSVK